MDVLASVTLSDENAIPDLAGVLEQGECVVRRTGPNRIDVAAPWGSVHAGTIEHAWTEMVFFLRAWQASHHEVVLRVEDLRFAAASRPVPTADAA